MFKKFKLSLMKMEPGLYDNLLCPNYCLYTSFKHYRQIDFIIGLKLETKSFISAQLKLARILKLIGLIAIT